MSNFPTAKLTSGMVVKNFGSPHPYTFNDGTILAACERELVEKTMFQRTETIEKTVEGLEMASFSINISDELIELLISECADCDIVLVPALLKEALKSPEQVELSEGDPIILPKIRAFAPQKVYMGANDCIIVEGMFKRRCIICSCYVLDRMTKVISSKRFYA